MTAISINSVSKKYRLFGSPRERLMEALHPFKKQYHREFWALKDISFDIPKGSTMGIIGRNGSGKSTLLQIICSVLQPTGGSVTVNGRISALLELGSGFNPDFTGRENVMLNGVLMGFTKNEMTDRLPVIEAFADIGEFFDQPLKIYSSGMAVRLAFAAAINVDPEILIVDEALAVGDAKFQNKCYKKFRQFQEAGKTIIFVTHDWSAVLKHCSGALLLEKGQVVKSGEPKEVVNFYSELLHIGFLSDKNDTSISEGANREDIQQPSNGKKHELSRFMETAPQSDISSNRKNYNKNEHRYGDKRAEIVDYLTVYGDEVDSTHVLSGKTLDIYIKVKVRDYIKTPMIGYSVNTKDGIMINASNTRFGEISFEPLNKGDIVIFKLSINLKVQVGDIFISVGIVEKDIVEDVFIDGRHDLIHLKVSEEKHRFDGMAAFDHEFQEVFRKSYSD